MAQTIILAVFKFIGALGLLLFGMDMLSNGIQKGAGNTLKKILERVSGNRFTAVVTGLVITCIIQSSSATTVMVVSFINAEIITLTQAIGIIFGANIGTTITAWIVSIFGFSFSIAAVSVPLFGIGFLVKKMKRLRIHDFGEVLMGFGLLFLGLGLLSDTLSFNAESVAFLNNFSDLGIGGILLGVLIGAVLTGVIHSSSAMTAIILTMAYNGSLSWELSAALVFGSNIGTTIDAILSSLDANTGAKRAAAVHLGFNVCGVILALIFFKPLLSLVDFITPGTPQSNITNHIAMLHTVFNICATAIFLPFVNQIAVIVSKIIKDKPAEKESHYKFPAILPSNHISVDFYTIQVEKEIAHMAEKVMGMFDALENAIRNHKDVYLEKISENVNDAENYVDEMNDEITNFIQECSRLPTSDEQNRKILARLIQITDALESLSDECCSMMHTLRKYISDASYDSNSENSQKISSYLELVRTFYEQVCQYIVLGISAADKLHSTELENQIDKVKKELKKASRKRIEAGGNVRAELQFIDIARKIEKTGDCVYSIVQAM